MTKDPRQPVVAIDGPAGAGKSTVTRRVAQELGYTRVDTGALYRAVAWLCLQRGVPFEDAPQVTAVAQELAQPGAIALSTSGQDVSVRVLGQEVTQDIRSSSATWGASQVSQLPEVRQALLSIQRELGRSGGVVLEGRDIGTVVFPRAEAKFYLTASTQVRAQRRLLELEARGDAADFEQVVDEVRKRDERDTLRPIAPLVQAPDAQVVDSSGMDLDQVVAAIVERVRVVEAQMGAAQAPEE